MYYFHLSIVISINLIYLHKFAHISFFHDYILEVLKKISWMIARYNIFKPFSASLFTILDSNLLTCHFFYTSLSLLHLRFQKLVLRSIYLLNLGYINALIDNYELSL